MNTTYYNAPIEIDFSCKIGENFTTPIFEFLNSNGQKINLAGYVSKLVITDGTNLLIPAVTGILNNQTGVYFDIQASDTSQIVISNKFKKYWFEISFQYTGSESFDQYLQGVNEINLLTLTKKVFIQGNLYFYTGSQKNFQTYAPKTIINNTKVYQINVLGKVRGSEKDNEYIDITISSDNTRKPTILVSDGDYQTAIETALNYAKTKTSGYGSRVKVLDHFTIYPTKEVTCNTNFYPFVTKKVGIRIPDTGIDRPFSLYLDSGCTKASGINFDVFITENFYNLVKTNSRNGIFDFEFKGKVNGNRYNTTYTDPLTDQPITFVTAKKWNTRIKKYWELIPALIKIYGYRNNIDLQLINCPQNGFVQAWGRSDTNPTLFQDTFDMETRLLLNIDQYTGNGFINAGPNDCFIPFLKVSTSPSNNDLDFLGNMYGRSSHAILVIGSKNQGYNGASGLIQQCHVWGRSLTCYLATAIGDENRASNTPLGGSQGQPFTMFNQAYFEGAVILALLRTKQNYFGYLMNKFASVDFATWSNIFFTPDGTPYYDLATASLDSDIPESTLATYQDALRRLYVNVGVVFQENDNFIGRYRNDGNIGSQNNGVVFGANVAFTGILESTSNPTGLTTGYPTQFRKPAGCQLLNASVTGTRRFVNFGNLPEDVVAGYTHGDGGFNKIQGYVFQDISIPSVVREKYRGTANSATTLDIQGGVGNVPYHDWIEPGLLTFETDAEALLGGLKIGQLYKTLAGLVRRINSI
jgi:hypothetical protein